MNRTEFHPAAWIAWCAAAVAVVQQTSQPVLLAVALGAFALVAVRAPQGGPFGLMLKVGLFALAVRVVLFGLAGHPGGTTIATIPVLHLPRLLGGVSFGGRITAEVLITSGVEGLRLAAMLVAFGVLLSAVEAVRLIRLVPRFLFEAGLIVAIGVAFVPSLVRTARDVRDAQRMRGLRSRGVRAIVSLAVPIVTSALERAVGVAESMESRGYGHARAGDPSKEARARGGALVSVLAASAGAFAVLLGWGPPAAGWTVLSAGCLGLTWSCVALSRLAGRTRYRRERLRGHDVALAVGAIAIAVLAIVGGKMDANAFSWTAYPAIHQPVTRIWAVLLVASLALPVVVSALRTRFLLSRDATIGARA